MMDDNKLDYMLADALGCTAAELAQLPGWLRAFCVELLAHGGEQQ
jgi:hypothetical protein